MGSAQSTKFITIEFTDISIKATLPLHPYLAAHPRLSVALLEDNNTYAETPVVNGDIEAGIWKINSNLCAYRNSVKQSVTLAVVASKESLSIRFASVKIGVAELLTRIEAQPEGHQEIRIGDASSSIQLIISCSVKAAPLSIMNNLSSQSHDNYTVIRARKNTQSHLQQKKLKLPSREDLESTYAKAIRISDQDEKAHSLSLLGEAYDVYYEETRGKADLEMMISMHEEAMKFTGPFHPQLAQHAYRLARALTRLFGQSGDPVDIERAISHYQTALEATEDLDAVDPAWLGDLGIALELRFDRLGDLSDLESAILFQRKAVKMTPDGHVDSPTLFNGLGNALKTRFEHLGTISDLEDAILNNKKAVELIPYDHPNKPAFLNNLGNALQARFKRLGSVADLEDAISNRRMAIEPTPDGHPEKPAWLNNLGSALQTRFERLGSVTDLEDSISNRRKAVELTPNGHPDQPVRLNNLVNALQTRFGCLGSITDLEDAISSHQKAVQLAPDGHPDRAALFNNLGSALQTRFEHLGSVTDLQDAISNKRKAVELTPDSHPGQPTRLNNLGNALQIRFELLGSIMDLEDAISNQRKAVELTPSGHPEKPMWLSGLGNALQIRFERLGSVADSEDAVSNQRKAVELTPDSHPEKPGWINNLGSVLQFRFMRLGNVADLEDAISSHRKAVELTPDGHPDEPKRLNNLGNALQTRFELLGSITDLADAISNHRRAVELTPNSHQDKLVEINSLGNALRSRFEHLGSINDLEDAVSCHRKVVELASDGHPGLPGWLSNLGKTLITRFRSLGILSDLESAISALSSAANSRSGSDMKRFKAACAWAALAKLISISPLDAFSCAINLLPRIAWLGLAVTDQHALLADVGGTVCDAVAAAIEYEEYETAVVWAEQGSAIVWQIFLSLRNPVDDLREAYPELANRLRRVAAQLEGSVPQETLEGSRREAPLEDVSHKYSKLALEWESLVDEIRRIPAFGGFLRAKSFSQLASTAHEGPVVILNVNGARCDALVLIADDSAERHVSVVNIPLERFSHEKSKNMFQTLTGLLSLAGVRERNDRKTGRAQSPADSDAKFKVILRVLWQDVVKPVIDGLAFQPESNRPPRIWWCATGVLAFLPIHAAGVYDTQEVGEKVSDYVISSYTPTLHTILELSDPKVQDDFQVLTVAQGWAPGAPPIPKTEDEVQVIHGLISGARLLNLTKEKATVERVREGMMESNWIHLACHGKQNSGDPMESGFLLHDRMLKLSEIVKMSLPKADFAFLSACQTAMGDEKVAEESVHLAAGMFLSGCRGVIATTWSIRDDDAPRIVQEVYSRMFKDGKPNRKEAAYALHEAVKLLRESGAPCTAWVPFIHIGR